MKKRIVEVAVKLIVAALTAFLTAITTTSCMGFGPLLFGPPIEPHAIQSIKKDRPPPEAGLFCVIPMNPSHKYAENVIFCCFFVLGLQKKCLSLHP